MATEWTLLHCSQPEASREDNHTTVCIILGTSFVFIILIHPLVKRIIVVKQTHITALHSPKFYPVSLDGFVNPSSPHSKGSSIFTAFIALEQVCVALLCQMDKLWIISIRFLAHLLLLGSDAGGYHHKFFERGKASLAEQIGRSIIKGTHSRKLNFITGSSPDVEAISDLRSEGWKSGDTTDLGTSKRSPHPTFTRAAEAADYYSPLPTLMQSGQGLYIDRPKETHRQCAMSLVPCHIVEYPSLATTYTLNEAINFTPMTRQSSQPYSCSAQVAAGYLIQQQQQEQVQSELSPTQSYNMAYLRAELMKTLLKSAAAVVPAAGDRQDYERLCLRSSDTMHESYHALSP